MIVPLPKTNDAVSTAKSGAKVVNSANGNGSKNFGRLVIAGVVTAMFGIAVTLTASILNWAGDEISDQGKVDAQHAVKIAYLESRVRALEKLTGPQILPAAQEGFDRIEKWQLRMEDRLDDFARRDHRHYDQGIPR